MELNTGLNDLVIKRAGVRALLAVKKSKRLLIELRERKRLIKIRQILTDESFTRVLNIALGVMTGLNLSLYVAQGYNWALPGFIASVLGTACLWCSWLRQ